MNKSLRRESVKYNLKVETKINDLVMKYIQIQYYL